MTALADFLMAQGLTAGAAPADFSVKLADDPAYVRVVSGPAENGTDDPDRPVVMVFSDGTGAPADSSPYEPTNAGDPVSPQQISQSAGSAPYLDGILHAFPSENVPPVVPPVVP